MCEDRAQEALARGYLEAKQVPIRHLRFEVSPRGSGAAEHFVRQHYPVEVREQRARATYQNVSLVTILDADVGSVADRHGQLEDGLRASELSPRGPTERIAVVVPKRAVETWVRWLLDPAAPVDEATDFGSRYSIDDCRRAGGRLPSACGGAVRDLPRALPSLTRGCEELRRVP